MKLYYYIEILNKGGEKMTLTEEMSPCSYDKYRITANVFKEGTDRFIFVWKDFDTGKVVMATTYQTTNIKEAYEKFRFDVIKLKTQ